MAKLCDQKRRAREKQVQLNRWATTGNKKDRKMSLWPLGTCSRFRDHKA